MVNRNLRADFFIPYESNSVLAPLNILIDIEHWFAQGIHVLSDVQYENVNECERLQIYRFEFGDRSIFLSTIPNY